MLARLIHSEFFHLITSRAAMAGLGAFLVSVVMGARVITMLKKYKLGEKTEKGDSRVLDGLMKQKRDTPTMGGIFLVAAMLVAVACFGVFHDKTLYILVGTVLALCGLGCVDDWLKLSGRSKTGMRDRTKLLGQIVIGYAAGVALYFVLMKTDPDHAAKVYVPWVGSMDLGLWYPAFVMLVIVSTSNAVNITDGLDGLAGGCMAISSLAYVLVAYAVGRVDFSAYLGVPYVHAAPESAVFCAAMLGATLGFLWYNSHPAQVFMGDSGSLPLGGALGLVACITKQETLLFFVGGVFVIEAASSLIQIAWFKMTGRRVFKIAPLHHHFQFGGMPETKITQRFWIGAAVLAVMSLATLKIR